jgi:hypothetical protein
MDTGPLVKSRIDGGRYSLERLVASGFDVSAAAWVKTAADEKWNLCVVSKTVEEKGLVNAYRTSREVLHQVPDPWVTTSELRLIRPDTPVGRHLLELHKRYEEVRTPVHLQTLRLGDVAALEVYLYPSVTPPPPGQQPLTPQEVVQKVVGLMGQTGAVAPARVTLQDGTTFLGVPVGVEMSGGRMHVKFAVDGPESSRLYPAEAIRAIE